MNRSLKVYVPAHMLTLRYQQRLTCAVTCNRLLHTNITSQRTLRSCSKDKFYLKRFLYNSDIFVRSRCFSKFSADIQNAGLEPNKPVPGLPFKDHEKGVLVYYGPHLYEVNMLKVAALILSDVVFPIFPIQYIYSMIQANMAFSSLQIIFLFCSTGLGMIGFPLIYHNVFMKKYVKYIYYKKESNMFTAATLTFFHRNKLIKFTPQDVEAIPPTRFYNCKVKGIPINLKPSLFRDRDALLKLTKFLASHDQGTFSKKPTK